MHFSLRLLWRFEISGEQRESHPVDSYWYLYIIYAQWTFSVVEICGKQNTRTRSPLALSWSYS